MYRRYMHFDLCMIHDIIRNASRYSAPFSPDTSRITITHLFLPITKRHYVPQQQQLNDSDLSPRVIPAPLLQPSTSPSPTAFKVHQHRQNLATRPNNAHPRHHQLHHRKSPISKTQNQRTLTPIVVMPSVASNHRTSIAISTKDLKPRDAHGLPRHRVGGMRQDAIR